MNAPEEWLPDPARDEQNPAYWPSGLIILNTFADAEIGKIRWRNITAKRNFLYAVPAVCGAPAQAIGSKIFGAFRCRNVNPTPTHRGAPGGIPCIYGRKIYPSHIFFKEQA